MKIVSYISCVCFLLLFSNSGFGSILESSVQVASIFSSGCVLQRETIGKIWGTAKPGETLTLKVKDQLKTSVADEQGSWEFEYDPEPAGGPYTLTVSGTESVTAVLTDVYFGDVWLLAGQSNMAHALVGQYGNFPHYYPEIPNSGDDFDHLRFSLLMGAEKSDGPADDVIMLQPWNRWEAEKLGRMSTAGYFFAHELKKNLELSGQGGIPLGFIKSAIGGTAIEQWIPAGDLSALEEDLILNEKKPPSVYYNGMIAPIQDYQIKGVLWYQGEANTNSISRVEQYSKLFEKLIQSWRNAWHNPDLPFYYVQLPPYGRYTEIPTEGSWTLMRKAQATGLSISNTGMACMIDAGFQGDLHPPYKDWVGERLARIALHHIYGLPIEYRGPVMTDCKISGDQVIISFDYVAEGLQTQTVDSQPDNEEVAAGFSAVSVTFDELAGFSLCGTDGIYYRASEAEIIGPDKVRISNPVDVPEPVSVQYAWQDYPRCNLFNSEGLPAEPFQAFNCEIGVNGGDLNVHRSINIYTTENRIRIENNTEQLTRIKLYDILAKQIKVIDNIESVYEFSTPAKGVYIAKVFFQEELVSNHKLIVW